MWPRLATSLQRLPICTRKPGNGDFRKAGAVQKVVRCLLFSSLAALILCWGHCSRWRMLVAVVSRARVQMILSWRLIEVQPYLLFKDALVKLDAFAVAS